MGEDAIEDFDDLTISKTLDDEIAVDDEMTSTICETKISTSSMRRRISTSFDEADEDMRPATIDSNETSELNVMY